MHDYMIQAGPHYSIDHGQWENGTIGRLIVKKTIK